MVGLATVLIIGPVLFTLLKNAIQLGFKGGLYCALGIIVSDIIVLLICYYIAGDVLDKVVKLPWVNFVAAGILLMLAFGFFFNPVKKAEVKEVTIGKGLWRSFYQGFLVNFVNPFVFIVWLGFIALAKEKYASEQEVILSMVGLLIGIFLTDVIKSLLASKLKKYLESEILVYFYKIVAIIIALAAIRIILLGLESYI